jgi:hypothetical protein
MNTLKGLVVATILLMGALVSPISISYAQTNLDSQTQSSGLASITPFGNAVVLFSSSSTAGEILRYKLDTLDANDITNLGLSVKEAAQLHQYLNDASKEERKDFKNLFHEYKKAVKLILQIGNGNYEKEFQEFSKKSITIEKKIEKLEVKDEMKDKIKHKLKLSKKQRELQRIKNHIFTLESFLADGSGKDKTLEELTEIKKEAYKKILWLKATKTGKELTEKDLEKIDKKVDNKVFKSNEKKDKDSKVSSSEVKQGKDYKEKKGNEKKQMKSKSKGNKK